MGQKKEIETLMQTAISNIKDLLQVNMVVGSAIQAAPETTIIPISKISCGFVAGGGEYGMNQDKKTASMMQEEESFPFGGGSGAGVSVKPVGFLAIENGKVRLISVDSVLPVERLIDAAPGLIQQVDGILHKRRNEKDMANIRQMEVEKDNSL